VTKRLGPNRYKVPLYPEIAKMIWKQASGKLCSVLTARL